MITMGNPPGFRIFERSVRNLPPPTSDRLFAVARRVESRVGRVVVREVVSGVFQTRFKALVWLVREGLGASCEVVEL